MATPTLEAPLFAPPPARVVPGTKLVSVGVYVFRCPLCANEFRYDDPYEPMCTGPGWIDSHAPEVMRFLRKDARLVAV